MVVRRLAASVVLLGLVAGAAWWLQDGPAPAPGTGDTAPRAIEIWGPKGIPFWQGTLLMPGNATPFSVLEEAARAGNFTIGVQHTFATLVVRIGPYAQDATGGWNFCVGDPTGWTWVPAAADQRFLTPGEGVRWVWVTDGGNGCNAQ